MYVKTSQLLRAEPSSNTGCYVALSPLPGLFRASPCAQRSEKVKGFTKGAARGLLGPDIAIATRGDTTSSISRRRNPSSGILDGGSPKIEP